jgi:hypothetical protein
VRTWANAGSALGVFANVYEPIAAADFRFSFADPTCPVIDDDGTTLTITGDCTDIDGVVRLGVATIERSGGDRAVALEGYGEERDGLRREVTGTVEITRINETNHEWSTDHVIEGGVTTTVVYEGSVAGDYDSETIWDGSGTITRDGVVSPSGTIDVTTIAQRRDDDVCPGESLSGETALVRGAQTATITYDGATECDEEHSAAWALDGADQGHIAGIRCAAGHAHGSTFAAWLAICAIVVQSRRRRVNCARSEPQRPSSPHSVRKTPIV